MFHTDRPPVPAVHTDAPRVRFSSGRTIRPRPVQPMVQSPLGPVPSGAFGSAPAIRVGAVVGAGLDDGDLHRVRTLRIVLLPMERRPWEISHPGSSPLPPAGDPRPSASRALSPTLGPALRPRRDSSRLSCDSAMAPIAGSPPGPLPTADHAIGSHLTTAPTQPEMAGTDLLVALCAPSGAVATSEFSADTKHNHCDVAISYFHDEADHGQVAG